MKKSSKHAGPSIPSMPEVIPCLRVSTAQQGASGLGLEGQKASVEAYARQTGAVIKADYCEIESGKRNDRPQLAKALAHARRAKATLVVAKLDRLSRNVAFLARLMETKVPFVACDMPTANELSLHIMAAVAQAEAKAISNRTKAARAAYKARGGKLGSARENHWLGHEQARLAGAKKGAVEAAKAHTKAAREAYSDLVPLLAEMKAQRLSLNKMAAKLNELGHSTRRGKQWSPMQVKRVALIINGVI